MHGLYDDIIIGAGLSALGVVMGLPASRRVLVLAGPEQGRFLHYDGSGTAPCAYLGAGGLGNAWHGVIPMMTDGPGAPGRAQLAGLLARFYPQADAARFAGSQRLFVPWRPLRPRLQFARLASQRPLLRISPEMATRFTAGDGGARVSCGDVNHDAARLWIAAGALHTPGLLDRSLGSGISRNSVADHVVCYAGNVDGVPAPKVERVRAGMYIPATLDANQVALYTLRPARFSFRRLDHGIEQRAAFGLPTGGVVAKLLRAMSAGLVNEALFNRFGVFARAARYSVYAQTRVPDAYDLRESADGVIALRPRTDAIRRHTDAARAAVPFAGMTHSRLPAMFLPGIHLHHTVDVPALKHAGINLPGSAVQVVDASVMQDIGPAHHSFRMLLHASELARHSA